MKVIQDKPRSIFDDYQTSPELERDGAWVRTSRGYEFRISRIGAMNVEYTNYLIQQGKTIQSEISALEGKSSEKLTPANLKKLNEMSDKMNEMVTESFARFIVKGWRNLYDREGKEIPYSIDNAIKLMRMNELYKELYPLALQYSTFLISNLETTAKN